MGLLLSPAVERAERFAVTRARSLGRESPTPADWLLALFDDEDARPSQVLPRIRVDRAVLLAVLAAAAAGPVHTATLCAVARDEALRLRADQEITTEILTLAAATIDPALATLLAEVGLTAGKWETALAGSTPPAAVVEIPPGTVFDMADPTDRFDAARAVDANWNRAREALRVIEDYARFARNDAGTTRRLKELRHAMRAAEEMLPPGLLVATRDVAGDVGTAVATPGEFSRDSARGVATANAKRLQESLRSAEEFGKIVDPRFARAVEQLRYSAYRLEAELLHTSDLRARIAECRLYVLLSASACRASLEWVVDEAVAGGAGVFQLREKNATDRQLLEQARRLREATRRTGTLFVVNDRPDLARIVDADGVHVGQDDLCVRDARRIVGAEKLVGVSTHDILQVRAAVADGADYLGVGPTFPSTTKPFDAFPGVAFVAAAVAETSLPAFALGGVNADTVGRVVAAGCRRVAVAAAVASADDPRAAAAALTAALTAGI